MFLGAGPSPGAQKHLAISTFSLWLSTKNEVLSVNQQTALSRFQKEEARMGGNRHMIAPLWVGTSGFSYLDWVGPVYPPDLAKSDWLSFYATALGLNACELNFTFYRMPSARVLAQMASKVPSGFRFTLKAPRIFTHEREATQADWEDFRRAVRPLQEVQKLGAVLVQFPYSYHNTPAHRRYLVHLRDRWHDLPLVVEFRNRGWVNESTFALLREFNMGFCCVDEPDFPNLMPPIAVVTGPIAYVRFHGRNREKWWRHEHPWERYDYEYTEAELEEWIPRIQHLRAHAQEVYLFANNHFCGKAVRTAQALRRMCEAVQLYEGGERATYGLETS